MSRRRRDLSYWSRLQVNALAGTTIILGAAHANAAMPVAAIMRSELPLLFVRNTSNPNNPCIGVGQHGEPTLNCPRTGDTGGDDPSGTGWGPTSGDNPGGAPKGGLGTPGIDTSGGLTGASGPTQKQNQTAKKAECIADCEEGCANPATGKIESACKNYCAKSCNKKKANTHRKPRIGLHPMGRGLLDDGASLSTNGPAAIGKAIGSGGARGPAGAGIR
jgi:hypothetical protein